MCSHLSGLIDLLHGLLQTIEGLQVTEESGSDDSEKLMANSKQVK